MKVVLPDNSELELPDGATGLDAARAIGPKLAEQAVLVRSNGSIRDLRAPLEDGEQIQILTTRDTHEPDALSVLRHSTAHLLAEAVRRLYPGTKIAIGPPIENGFYYDFEFPEPIREEDLERIEAEILRQLDEGRSWDREDVSAAVKKMNDAMLGSSQSLQFSIDEDSKDIVVKVIDQSTKEVVRQIPSKEALQIAKSLDKSIDKMQHGLLIDHTAGAPDGRLSSQARRPRRA